MNDVWLLSSYYFCHFLLFELRHFFGSTSKHIDTGYCVRDSSHNLNWIPLQVFLSMTEYVHEAWL